MQRGHLVAYDSTGKGFFIGCEASGDILPHEMPVGDLKVIELPFGALNGVLAWHFANGELVIDELAEVPPTYEETLEENKALKLMILESEGVI